MKTKEKILGGLFIMLTLLFIGCRQSITPDEKLSLEKEKQEQRESREREEFLLEQIGKEIDVERFIVINLGKDCTYILLDKHMRTMYLMKKSASSFRASGFMSLLVDSLGKPILYRGELPEYWKIEVSGNSSTFFLLKNILHSFYNYISNSHVKSRRNNMYTVRIFYKVC